MLEIEHSIAISCKENLIALRIVFWIKKDAGMPKEWRKRKCRGMQSSTNENQIQGVFCPAAYLGPMHGTNFLLLLSYNKIFVHSIFLDLKMYFFAIIFPDELCNTVSIGGGEAC